MGFPSVREITRIIVHHSASPRATTTSQIESWHRARGFDGIGYHYVIDEEGDVHRTRPPDVMGAHAKGANLDSLGICITGDNTTEEEKWTPMQISTLRVLVRSLRTAFGDLLVEGHRWSRGHSTATKCPGLSRDAWDSLVATLQ